MTQEADVGFTRLKGLAVQRSIPLSAHLELTYACSWRCVFCYNSRRIDKHPLGLPEWLTVLDDLRTLGAMFVTLTGGEPTLYPEFFAIARAARGRHLAVRVATNGSRIDERAADELAGIWPLSVELSVHGATAATHDHTTGVPGSFSAVWRAIDRLRARSLPVVLRCPVTILNCEEIDELVAVAKRAAIPLRVDPNLAPRDDGSTHPLAFLTGESGLRHVLEHLDSCGQLPMSRRRPGGCNCGLGRSTVAIDPEGFVYPCIQWRHSTLGNIRQRRLAVLWRESEIRRQAGETADRVNEWLLSLPGPASQLPFCPAEAILRDGHPYATSKVFEQQVRWFEECRAAS